MKEPRDDAREALREDLLAGERGAEERVRAHLARGGAGSRKDAELEDALRWTEDLARGHLEAAPDHVHSRLISYALPVGRPRRTPAWKRALTSSWMRGAVAAASLALLAGLAWAIWQRARSNDAAPEHGGGTAYAPSAASERWIGSVEFRDADGFDAHRRALLGAGRNEIATGAHERAAAALDPWLAGSANEAPQLYRASGANAAQTTLEVDTRSKVVTQLYDDRAASASWMAGAYELARAYFGTAVVQGPILEIQVVAGSARLQHNGTEIELHDAEMVLLARQGAPVRVEAPAPALGEPPAAELAREAAEGEAAERPSSSPDLGWIEGYVRDREGRLLDRFELTTWRVVEGRERNGGLRRETLFFFSTPDGHFELEGLEPGRYRLGIASPEHVTLVTDEVDVPRGGAPEALEVALDPGVPLRGRVVSAANGRPVANARVRVANVQRRWWWTASDTFGELRTESDGSFACANRPTGYENLWVEAEGFASQWVPFVPLPGTPLEIPLERESVLHGYVSDAFGEPRPGLEVAIHGTASCFHARAKTDARGYYRIGGLGRGTYRIAVVDLGPCSRPARLAELDTAHVRREDFVGEIALAIEGVLRDGNGGALAKHDVLCYEIANDGALRLAPSARTTSGADGSFRVELAAGVRYRLRVDAPDHAWSADLDELTADERTAAKLASFTLAGHVVSGSVCLAEPEQGASILRGGRLILSPFGEPRREWRAAVRDGSFVFRAVPAGRYRLHARIRGLYLPDREIEVGSDESTLALTASRAARVELLPRDANQKPVLEITAGLRTANGERPLRTRATPLGLSIDDLPAEAIELVLRAEGYEPVSLRLDLARDAAPRVEVELKRR